MSKVKISQPQPIEISPWLIACAVGVLLLAGMLGSAVVAYWFVGGW